MDASMNQLKFQNYREQSKRLKQALNSGFNLEAMFIEYAIMEDRTESILHHAGKWEAYLKTRKGKTPTINSKVHYLQKLALINNDLLHKYFSDNLLDQLLAWKDERNRLIHALLEQALAHNEVCALAEKGKQLVDELKKRASIYNRSVDRRKAKGIL